MVMRPLHDGNEEEESRAYNNVEKVSRPLIAMSQRKYHTLY